VRKLLFPLAVVTAVLAFSVQSFAAATPSIYAKLVTVDSTHWQVWAQDVDPTGTVDMGISGFGVQLNTNTGTITAPTGNSATSSWVSPHDRIDTDSGPGNSLGFAQNSVVGSGSAQVSLTCYQGNSTAVIQTDAGIYFIGQNAMAGTGLSGNHGGVFVGDADPYGDTVSTASTPSTNNLAGWVEMFQGTNSAGAVPYITYSASAGSVFKIPANTDANDFSAQASTGSAVVLGVPEPASLALLALGGLLVLPRRRHA